MFWMDGSGSSSGDVMGNGPAARRRPAHPLFRRVRGWPAVGGAKAVHTLPSESSDSDFTSKSLTQYSPVYMPSAPPAMSVRIWLVT